VIALPTTLVVDGAGHVVFRSRADSTVDAVIGAVP
jgi:hypothetical protein